MRPQGLIRQIVEEIESGDFAVAALDAGDGACDWAYTIGLHRSYGHPELIVVGLDCDIAGALLDMIGHRVAEGLVLGPHEEYEVAEGFVVGTAPVDHIWLARGEWFVLGRVIMDTWGLRWPTTLQLVWADASGARPEIPGEPEWMLRQPLLNDGDPAVLKPDRRLW